MIASSIDYSEATYGSVSVPQEAIQFFRREAFLCEDTISDGAANAATEAKKETATQWSR